MKNDFVVAARLGIMRAARLKEAERDIRDLVAEMDEVFGKELSVGACVVLEGGERFLAVQLMTMYKKICRIEYSGEGFPVALDEVFCTDKSELRAALIDVLSSPETGRKLKELIP